jgi:hypothetical protein
MRTLFIILLAIIVQTGLAQTNKSSVMKEIPVGSHVYLQVDEINNDILVHILAIEKYDKELDPARAASLFEKTPEPGTIELYFGNVRDGGQFKSVLLIRNNTKYILEYQAKISYPDQREAVESDVKELLPDRIINQSWNDNLKGISLSGFKVKKYEP